MVKNQVKRLERMAHQLFPTAPPAPEITATAEERVQALRRLLGMLPRVGGKTPVPFPSLDGEAYVLAFWPWLLANGGPWPQWAQATALRLCRSYLRNAGLIDANGRLTRLGRNRLPDEAGRGANWA